MIQAPSRSAGVKWSQYPPLSYSNDTPINPVDRLVTCFQMSIYVESIVLYKYCHLTQISQTEYS